MSKYGYSKVITLPKLYKKYPRKELVKLNKSKTNKYSPILTSNGFKIQKLR